MIMCRIHILGQCDHKLLRTLCSFLLLVSACANFSQYTTVGMKWTDPLATQIPHAHIPVLYA